LGAGRRSGRQRSGALPRPSCGRKGRSRRVTFERSMVRGTNDCIPQPLNRSTNVRVQAEFEPPPATRRGRNRARRGFGWERSEPDADFSAAIEAA
jgi:hypothetical protein